MYSFSITTILAFISERYLFIYFNKLDSFISGLNLSKNFDNSITSKGSFLKAEESLIQKKKFVKYYKVQKDLLYYKS